MAITVSAPVTAAALSLDLLGSSGTTLVQAAIYSDNSGPNTVLVSSTAQPIASSTGWNNLAIPSTPLSPGTYWIALQANGVLDIYVNTSGGRGFHSYTAGVSFTSGSCLSPMPSGAADSNNYSFYAVVCGLPTPTATVSMTPTMSPTPSVTLSSTATASPTPSLTKTFTPTITPTPTITLTPTITPTWACPGSGTNGYLSDPASTSDDATLNFTHFSRVYFPVSLHVTGMEVPGLGTEGSKLVGLYDDNGLGTAPTTLMASAGYSDTSTGTNHLSFTSSISVATGYKWLAISPASSGSATFYYPSVLPSVPSYSEAVTTGILPPNSASPPGCATCAGPQLSADWTCP